MMKKIVIIDDNSIARQILKHQVFRIFKHVDEEYHVFSSDNGVEGLGLVYTTRPDIIIVDITLPKYSGQEVVGFLIDNESINDENIIVLHEDNITDEIRSSFPKQCKLISKKDPDSLKKLMDTLAPNNDYKSWLRDIILQKAIRIANKSDIFVRDWRKSKNPFTKVFKMLSWFYYQFYLNIITTIIHFWIGEVHDDQIKQKNADNRSFRVRAYPTLTTVFISAFVLVFQLVALVAGGLVIFNTRFTSVFANFESRQVFELSNSEYDSDFIIYNGVSMKLKELNPPSVLAVSDGSSSSPDSYPGNVENKDKGKNNNQKNEDKSPGQQNTENNKQDKVLYPSSPVSIKLNDSIQFTDLNSIVEISNLNTEESSTLNKEVSNKGIHYQLSPNGVDWYFYSKNNGWEIAQFGWKSANSVQEVNKYLSEYEDTVGDSTGELYVQMFFKSDGNTPIELKSLEVSRSLEIVSVLDDKVQPELESNQLIEDEISFEEEYRMYVDSQNKAISTRADETSTDIKIQGLKAINILEASFYNNTKKISGEILIDNSFNADLLENMSVQIYYTTDTNLGSKFNNKTEYIGEAQIQSYEKFGQTHYVWSLETPGRDGGYVGAILLYTDVSNSSEVERSNPVQNSTFTVNEGGDESDHRSGDGSCDHDPTLPGSQCSLRAAIQESNTLDGIDNIFFRIPTYDPSYRDLDRFLQPSSGDNEDSDDYWRLMPESALPTIIDSVNIDGSTQKIFVGDTNGIGHEIEINGSLIQPSEAGLSIQNTSLVTIKSLAINEFKLEAIKLNNVQNSEISENYLGTNVNGYIGRGNGMDGLLIQDSSSITVVKNLVSGNKKNGINIVNSDNNVITTNLIGISIEQNKKIPNQEHGISISGLGSNSNVIGEFGGFAGNTIGGNMGHGIFIGKGASDNLISANYIGTSSEEIKLGNSSSGVGTLLGAEPVGAGNIVQYNIIKYNNTAGTAGYGGVYLGNQLSSITLKGNIIDQNGQYAPINLQGGIQDEYFVTANDKDDLDLGANGLQNFPIINSVEYIGNGKYVIYGDIDSNETEAPFTIEVCESSNSANNHGGCKKTLGTTATTSSSWILEVEINGSNGLDEKVFSALATNKLGSTSEFSRNFNAIISNPNYTITDFITDQLKPENGETISSEDLDLEWIAYGDPNEIDNLNLIIEKANSNEPLIYKLDGNEISFSLSEEIKLEIGDYQWRIDIVKLDGSIIKGNYNSFSIAGASDVQVSESTEILAKSADTPGSSENGAVTAFSRLEIPLFLALLIGLLAPKLIGIPLLESLKLLFIPYRTKAHGKVVDKNDISISGLKVKLIKTIGNSKRIVEETRTNIDGTFKFQVIKKSNSSYQIKIDEFSELETTSKFESDADSINIKLKESITSIPGLLKRQKRLHTMSSTVILIMGIGLTISVYYLLTNGGLYAVIMSTIYLMATIYLLSGMFRKSDKL